MKKKYNGHNRKSGFLCVNKLIYSINIHSLLYANLFTPIEFVLTLYISHVNSERVFSKLKIIENHLRSYVRNQLKKTFLTVEEDILDENEFGDILEIVKSSSPLTSK